MATLNPYQPPQIDVARPELRMPGGWLPASRGARLLARMIDVGLWVASALPGVLLTEVDETLGILSAAVGLLALTVVQWFLIATTGQSLAKRWLAIRIVSYEPSLDSIGHELGFYQGVVLRNWILDVVAFIPGIGGLVSLWDAVMIFNQDRRCLHDRIAGTLVIKVGGSAEPPTALP